MAKSVFKSVGKIAPFVAPFLPVAPLLAAGIGAAGSAISGGGLKGALLGGIGSGLGSAFAGNTGLGSSIFGTAAGSPLSSVTGNALLQGPTRGTGMAGAIGRGVSGVSRTLGGMTGAGSGGGGFGLRDVGSVVGGLRQYSDQDEMEKQLLRAQGRAEEAIQPYSNIGLNAQRQLSNNLAAGFNPGDLENDAGYQYRLGQGNQQLERALAAQGMSGSGSAIKAAQELGQGLAAQQYDSAYNQYLQQNQQLAGLGDSGQRAANTLGGIYGNQGNIQANRTLEQGNIFANTLSSVLGQRIIGYDPTTGRPIYG